MFRGAFNLKPIIQKFHADIPHHRKSATNCARTYGVAYAQNEGNLPQDWPYTASLKGDHIYDGFLIISLLEDHSTRNSILGVPHHGDQAKRFTEAIRARNARIRLYGQPEILHCCDVCMRIYEKPGTGASFLLLLI
jgi:hypothetical protein